MFDLIKFNSEVHEVEISDKKFLCSKNLNYLNQKIGIIPEFAGLNELLEELRKDFKNYSEVKIFFNKTVTLKLFFNQLVAGSFFIFKRSIDDNFIFHPKHSMSLSLLDSKSFDLNNEVDDKVFLRRINKKWIIDSPSSPFYVAYDEDGRKSLELSDLSPEFNDCLRMNLFSKSSISGIDFKDELFLNEVRKRSDIPKGAMKIKKQLDFKYFNKFDGKSLLKLNLFDLPTKFRPNSSRTEKQISYKSFLNLIQDLSAIHAVLDDPYFGRVNKKNYPSAGSAYGLIPIIYVANVKGVEKGVYRVDEENQTLVELKVSNTHFQNSMNSFRNSWGAVNGEPPLTIQFIFSPILYYQKYSQTCLALNFLNGGVLIAEVYKLAQLHGLGACALGGINEDLWSEMTSNEYYSICEISLCGGK